MTSHKINLINVFAQMVEAAVDVWKDAQIFILPLIQRKDLPYRIVNNANDLINTACAQYKVTVLKQFQPEVDMYYDDVHLNDKVHPAGDVTKVSVMPRKVTMKIGAAENRCR